MSTARQEAVYLLRNGALRQDRQVGKRKDIEVTLRIFSATFSQPWSLLCSADTKRGAIIMHYGKNDGFHIVAARGRRSVDC
jgi:hypothetical protein